MPLLLVNPIVKMQTSRHPLAIKPFCLHIVLLDALTIEHTCQNLSGITILQVMPRVINTINSSTLLCIIAERNEDLPYLSSTKMELFTKMELLFKNV